MKIIENHRADKALVLAFSFSSLALPIASIAADPALTVPISQGGLELEEVVVTAQKRSENLEDVPVAVTAISGTKLREQRVDTADDLQSLVPGLIYNQGGATTQTYLRGIGNNIAEVNADPSVATYIDGIYISSAAVTAVQLADIQAVEVLKGPQGTLYGRNATGGAINITTLSPTDQFQARLTSGVGNYGRLDEGGSLSGPLLGDYLLGGLYVTYWGHDSYTTISNPPGVPVPRVRDKDQQGTARGKLIFDPNSIIKVTAAGDFTGYGSFDDNAWRQLQSNAAGYAQGAIPNQGHYSVSLNNRDDAHYETAGGSVRTDVDLGSTALVETSAYRRYNTFWRADLDATTAAPGYTSDVTVANQWSHELQWLSKNSGSVQWIAGLFYYTDDGGQFPFQVYPPPVDVQISSRVDDTSYAGYGQAIWSIVDSLRLTVGGRYNWEKKEYEGGSEVVSTAAGLQVLDKPLEPQSKHWTNFSPKVGLDYRIDDTLLYLSYSEGFKSGVYNLFGTTPKTIAPVNPETLDAYEIGSKSEFLNKRVRINTSLFYYDYTNLQVQTLVPTPGGASNATLQNAATAYTSGLDFDANWVVVSDLQLRILGEFLRSHYGSFTQYEGYAPVAVGNTPVTVNVSGYSAARTAPFSGNIGVDYVNHLPQETELRWSASLYHTGGFAFTADHRATQNAYTTLELSAELGPESHAWNVLLWAKNLTNEYYFTYKNIDNYGTYGVAGAPRTFGLTGTWYFGKSK